jgi:hypothetical protein
MNMISTGAFLPEMDASNKQETIAEKFARVWEKKNSKVARAGGVSLMALSLAACGSSSSDTAAVTPTPTPTPTPDPEPEAPTTPVVVEPQYLTDSAVTGKTDGLTGDPSGGNDTYIGDKDTIEAGDIILDSGGDADTANLSDNGDLDALTISGVETVNVTISNIAVATAQDVDAANFSGVEVLTVTKSDVSVGGSTLAGNKAITVTNVNADNVAKVVAGVDTTNLVVTQATKAGAVIDADAASGNVDIDGVGTITAMGMGTGDTLDVDALGVAAEDAKALEVTTSAAVVNVEALTGSINITAESAVDVILAGATGGATVVAKGDKGTAGTDGIKITGVDASGVSVTTSYVGSSTNSAEGEIQLLGTAKSDDVATVSAAGVTNLDLDTAAIETVNLSGNGQAVTFNIVDLAATTYAASGEHDVTLAGNVNKFDGKTVTGAAKLDLNAGTAADIDLSAVDTATTIDLGYDNAGDVGGTEMIFTVASGATFEVTTDQTDMVVDYATSATASDLNIIAGDVNGATNTAVGTLDLTDLDINSALAGTVTVTANEANFTTNSFTAGAKQTVTLIGDEDFTLGTVTAKSVDASQVSGIVTATTTTSALTFTTGSGADVMTVNGDAVHKIVTGSGNDDISIDDTKDASTFDAGAGDDTVRIDQVGGVESIVVTLGDGDDTMILAQDSDAIIVAGDGSDTLDINSGDDFSNNANFAFTGFEKLDIVGATSTTISAAQLAGNGTFAITSDDDTLNVNVVAAAGGSLDASGITIASGSVATLVYTGSAKADTITGGKEAETIAFTVGGDSIDGGAGTDTFTMADSTLNATALGVTGSDTSTGAVINLSDDAVTGTTIYAATSQYTGSNASVEGGTSTHVYAANKTTNSTEVTSISGVENVTGGDGADYIVGSGSNNALKGAAGADVILGGDGDDYILGAGGADTVTGGNGADKFAFHVSTTADADTIKDFTSSDIIVFGADDATNTADLFDGGETVLAATDASALTVDATGNGGSTAIDATDYNEAATATGTLEADHINVLTGAGGASVAAVFNAIDDGAGTMAADNSDMILVFYNTGTAKVEMWDVTDAGTSAADYANGTATQIATLEGIAAADIAATFSEANFHVELIA